MRLFFTEILILFTYFFLSKYINSVSVSCENLVNGQCNETLIVFTTFFLRL